MPRKKKIIFESEIQEKLDYLGLDLNKIDENLTRYTQINFRSIKGYEEKKYKQYRFINVNDIEILLSPTNRVDSIKTKYEEAMPLAYYLDSQNEENLEYYTKFLELLKRVRIMDIEHIEEEQKKLLKQIPFKIKYTGNYLWQIYYSKTSNKYFMIVPTEDSDCSTFFYVLKKKIENNPDEKIFVPISIVDYKETILPKDEIKDLENILWLFTKDYPLIYEVWNKKDEMSLYIIGETEIFDNIRSMYRIELNKQQDGIKFYKLVKALFILQTELPHYFHFYTNIDKNGKLEFLYKNVSIKYDILQEFIYEQYLKSISLKKKADSDFQELNTKIADLQLQCDDLTREYTQKEKQITTYLECKKTFLGKVKYFFKYGKKSKSEQKDVTLKGEKNRKKEESKNKKEKVNIENKSYTLYELEESYKELEQKQEQNNKLIMDINALKLKNKNLIKKIKNATNYIEEINQHKKSIFEFWKYANKDEVATLDEGEQEELNVTKIEKIFNYEEEFEDFGIKADKLQRSKFTDDELDSSYIASTDMLKLINKIELKTIENKEISDKLKDLKMEKEQNNELELEDEDDNIFGKLRQTNNKERTMENKTHRESPRDKYEILEVRKGIKGIELKRNLEKVLNNIKTALTKNNLTEDTYVYIVTSSKLKLGTIEQLNLDCQDELNTFLKNQKDANRFYINKIKVPKGSNYIAFSNIIFFDNKNMTLPIGMNLSKKILVNLSEINLNETKKRIIKKICFEDEKNDFSKITIKEIMIKEYEVVNEE